MNTKTIISTQLLHAVVFFKNKISIKLKDLPLLPISWPCKEAFNWFANLGLCLLVLGTQVTADISGKRTFTSRQT